MSKFLELPQWQRGQMVEGILDVFCKLRGYSIRKLTQDEERKLCLGDRELTKNGTKVFIEYKSGIQTHYTGNVWLETISVDDPDHYKLGWVYTSQANYIIWAAILDNCLLFYEPEYLRAHIEEWKKMFREVPTSHNQNDGYNTWGLIVPLAYAKEHVASYVFQIFK